MKLTTIIGTRPQFIKFAPVYAASKHHDNILIHTGQHYDDNLSEIFFKELELPKPDYNLNVGSGTHAEQTGTMLTRLGKVIPEDSDCVIVYGDTNSTLAGALAAVKMNIPVVHVEAGCRSFDKSMPEEINRIVVDHISDLNLAPSYQAVRNLNEEKCSGVVRLVGDTLVDAIRMFAGKTTPSGVVTTPFLKKQYNLMTIHRQENTDNLNNLKKIIVGVSKSKLPIIFPVHPRTVYALGDLDGCIPQHIRMIEPVGYIDMLCLMMNANKIITDSGGIQHEAAILGTPCITLRDSTEWPETVSNGWNVLVGADSEKIKEEINKPRQQMKPADKVYPAGAAKKIVKAIEERFG